MEEGKLLDKKSLRFLKEKNTDWDELAKDCISFANAHGGNILIGIENNDDLPPENQKIEDKSILESIHKKISERTINVSVIVTSEIASNKAEYIKINIPHNKSALASTTDGKYYVRIADVCKPIMPEDIVRVAADKNAFIWEVLITMQIEKSKVDEKKKADFLNDVRASLRVSAFIKDKSDEEILDYYEFQKDGYLTNLGILWIGQRRDRSSLLHAPTIQVIRYNDMEEKVWKMMFDDFYLNPKEIITLGLLAQQSYSATELSKILNQGEEQNLRNWFGRLFEYGLVEKTGEGKGTQYSVSSKFTQLNRIKRTNTQKRVSDTHLEEIICKDIIAHPNSSVSEIHARIGNEINLFKLKRMLGVMLDRGILSSEGVRKMMKYFIKQNLQEKP